MVQDHEEVVQGVLEDLEEVVHLELDDLEKVVHLELVDDLDDVVHFELVEVELQGVEVDLEEVQRLEVVLRQLVVTTGLPAVVMRWTSQFSEVVVVAGHSLPGSRVAGETGQSRAAWRWWAYSSACGGS